MRTLHKYQIVQGNDKNIYFSVKQLKFLLPKKQRVVLSSLRKICQLHSRGRDNGTVGNTCIHLPRCAARIGRLKNHRAIWLTAFANENFIKPEVSPALGVFLARKTSGRAGAAVKLTDGLDDLSTSSRGV